MGDRLLDAARRLHALARTGLHFCAGEYDRERYEQIERIAAELLADGEPASCARLLELWSREEGYVTPKIDVRGAVFRGGAVLLVRERADGLWTLPGGWADVGETPSQAVTREIEQESGIRSRVISLAALLDRPLHGPSPGLFHSWKALLSLRDAGRGAARQLRDRCSGVLRRRSSSTDVARAQHPRAGRPAARALAKAAVAGGLRLTAAQRRDPQRSMRYSRSALWSSPASAFSDHFLFSV